MSHNPMILSVLIAINGQNASVVSCETKTSMTIKERAILYLKNNYPDREIVEKEHYVTFRRPWSRRVDLKISERKNGASYALSLPKNFDLNNPKILRLTHFAGETDYGGDYDLVSVYIYPDPESFEEFKRIRLKHDIDEQFFNLSIEAGEFNIAQYRDRNGEIYYDVNHKDFFKELENSSCCAVAKDDYQFRYLEQFEIPNSYIMGFLETICPVLLAE